MISVITKTCSSPLKCFQIFQVLSLKKSHNSVFPYANNVCVSVRHIFMTGAQDQDQEVGKGYIEQKIPVVLEKYSGVTEDEIKTLFAARALITNDMVEEKSLKKLECANERVRTLLNYVLPSAFTCTGALLLGADRFYADQRRAKNTMLHNEDEHFRLVSILCWIFEMVIQGTAVHDDVMHEGTTRQNIPCWHNVPGVGLRAVRDGDLLMDGYIVLLKKYFGLKDYYPDLLELFAQGLYELSLGLTQTDTIRADFGGNIARAMEQNMAGKSFGFGTFYVFTPVIAAMMINGVRVPELMETIKEISLDTGLFVALCEDYIDCYGELNMLERYPNDIPEGKQTWLYYKALELASPAQTELLLSSYGKKDAASVDTVLNIYEQLQIQSIMKNMLERLEKDLHTKVSMWQNENVPWSVFLNMSNYYSHVVSGEYIL